MVAKEVQQLSGNVTTNPQKKQKIWFRRIACLLLFAFLMNSSVMVLNTISLARTVSGTVAIANGGTGATSAAMAVANLGAIALENTRLMESCQKAYDALSNDFIGYRYNRGPATYP
jgi:hypothetical protein